MRAGPDRGCRLARFSSYGCGRWADSPAVIPAKAGIQYAAAFRFYRWRLWNTGSAAFAGDDSGIQISNSQDDIVIASQRVGAKRRPMTGSAKQSISPRKGRMDCFVASLLAMTTN
jgi:hypothetical protein